MSPIAKNSPEIVSNNMKGEKLYIILKEQTNKFKQFNIFKFDRQ